MRQLSLEDSGSEPKDDTVLLAEVVALIGRKDYQARGLAFEMLYKYYQKPIERYLATRIYDQEHVLDLCQITFMRVWTTFQRLETALPQTVDHVRNWLYKIATDVAIDDYRKIKSKDIQSLPENEVYNSFAELVVEGEDEQTHDRLWLREELSQLPTQYGECLRLSLIGYTYQEIAAIKGIAEKTVSANVSRGKTQLYRKYYPVTVDLQRAEELHIRDAIYNLIRGVEGIINVGKIEEHELKARDRQHRMYMRKHSSDIRKDLLVDIDPRLVVGEGMPTNSGIWVPKGLYVINEEDLVPVTLDDLG